MTDPRFLQSSSSGGNRMKASRDVTQVRWWLNNTPLPAANLMLQAAKLDLADCGAFEAAEALYSLEERILEGVMLAAGLEEYTAREYLEGLTA